MGRGGGQDRVNKKNENNAIVGDFIKEVRGDWDKKKARKFFRLDIRERHKLEREARLPDSYRTKTKV